MFKAALQPLSRLFGYDAAETRGRRRQASTSIQHEDNVATERRRKILQSTAQDLQRNFVICRWAIGKHLDYVSSFSFQGRTGDTGLDEEIEALLARESTRHRFDTARRHPLRRAVRLTEARRVVDGDIGWIKFTAAPAARLRGKIAAVEADRIQNPPRITSDERGRWFNGVLTTPSGAAVAYGVYDRKGTGYKWNRRIPARNMLWHGFYDRFDQVRGVSPITAALNWYRDTYEGFEYALAKVKVSQLFGLTFYHNSSEAIGTTPTATVDTDSDGVNDDKYEVDLGRGPWKLELDGDDRAEIVESKTPSGETTDFLKLMVHIALRSLDIPFSFFDESFTNFYGSRGGLIQYQKACKNKVQDLQELLNDWTRWRLGLAVEDGSLVLPRGMSFDRLAWEWVPDGVPWWDPVKEVKGHTAAIAAGLDNPQNVAQSAGSDFYNNVDKIAEAQAYAESRGVKLTLAGVTGEGLTDTDEGRSDAL